MRILTSLLVGLSLALPLTARAGDDLPLNRVLQEFTREKQSIEATQLAIYADQLESLRQSLVAKENAAAAEKVSAEYKSIMTQLAALQASAAKAEPIEKTTDKNMRTIFENATEEGKAQAKPERKGAIILRPNTAKWLPEGTSHEDFWKTDQAAQQWTLTEIPSGKYKVRLEFRAAEAESGGTGQLELSGNATPIPFRIISTETNAKKIQSKDIAILEIEKCPVDLTIRSNTRNKTDGPLFELVAVWLHELPAGKEDAPAKPKPVERPERTEPADPTRKKVDF